MAFASGFRNDVFVSYAHLDNVDPIGGQRPVSRLVECVDWMIRRNLGHRGDLKVFFDNRDLGENQEIEVALEEARGSALFVAMVSPAYVNDQSWALREMEAFLAGPDASDRFFALEVMPFEECDCPDVLVRRKRRRFWKDGGAERPAPMMLDPAIDRALYSAEIAGFTDRLARRLRELQQRAAADGETGGGDSSAQPVAPVDAQAAACRGTVLLTQVTDDLEFEREGTARFLAQAGVKVLPEGDLPQGGADFAAAYAGALEGADMVVQLLSHAAGRAPADLPGGYQHHQQAAAVESGKPLMVWRHPDTDLSRVTHERHRALLEGEATMAMGLESFKAEVLRRLDALRAPRREVRPQMIYVGAERGDLELARELERALSERHFPVVLPFFDGSAEEIRQDMEENLLEKDAILIVHGKAPALWVRRYLNRFYTKLLQQRAPPKVIGLLRGPPPEKSDINLSLPHLQVVDCTEELDIDRVIALFEQES